MSQNLIRDSPRFTDLVNTYAWVTRGHSAALRNLASEIARYYVSYVRIADGVVSTSPGNAHTPTVEEMLYRLHVQPYTADPGEKVGRVIDCRISLDELKGIREDVAEAVRVIEANSYPTGCMGLCLKPFIDVEVDLLKLIRGKNVTSNKAVEKYEDAAAKFRKKLMETQWDNLPKAEPPTITETEADLSRAYVKEDIWMPYLKNFPTDFDRVATVFYLSGRGIDNAFREYKALVENCKEKSGFLKGPPPELTQSTIQAMSRLFDLLAGLVIPCNLSDKYIRQPVFKQEAIKAVDKALEKAAKQGHVDGKDARRLISYYLGFEIPNSLTRWMNR